MIKLLRGNEMEQKFTVKVMLVDDHEIDLDEMLIDVLIKRLQEVKTLEGYSQYTRVYIDNDYDHESYYASIKIFGERPENKVERLSRLQRVKNSESTAKQRREAQYLKLKEEFE
jgi:hypothetical protein